MANKEEEYILDNEGNPRIFVDRYNNVYCIKANIFETTFYKNHMQDMENMENMQNIKDIIEKIPEEYKIYIRQTPIKKEYNMYDVRGNPIFEMDGELKPIEYIDDFQQVYYIKTVYYFNSNDEYNNAVCNDDLKFYLF